MGYGEQQVKNKIFTFSPEVGDASDGFWPAAFRIVPLCMEQVQQNMRIACLAGECLEAEPEVPCESAGTVVPLPVRWKNFGSYQTVNEAEAWYLAGRQR